jgi:hypothetical protein
MSTLLAFVESYFADPDYSTRIVAPNADYFNVDIGSTGDSLWMIVNPTLDFSNGTLTLPPASTAVNDQEITVVFTRSVLTLVIASSGATILGAPTQVAGYDSFRVRYNASQATWYTLDTTGTGAGGGVSQIVRQDFTGDGATTTFVLSSLPLGLGNQLQIFIDGVYQERASYTVTGLNLIFGEAPPSLSTIEVLGWTVSLGASTTANLVAYSRDGLSTVTNVAEELDRTTTANMVAYELGTTAAASAHPGIATGYIIRTNYFDSALTSGSGAEHRFTGTTTAGKAGNWPDADGYFYDADGKQFLPQGSPVSVRCFGAVGNGTANDTDAIQTMLNSTAYNSIHAPAGTYRCNLIIERPVVFYGDGYRTVLKSVVTATPVITMQHPTLDATGIREIYISDLRVDGNGNSMGVYVGFVIVYSSMKNINIDNTTNGLVLDQTQNMYFDGIFIDTCAIGLNLVNGSGSNEFNNLHVVRATSKGIFIGQDPSLYGYTQNVGYGQNPAFNKINMAIVEQGTYTYALHLSTGKRNYITNSIFTTSAFADWVVKIENACLVPILDGCFFSAAGITNDVLDNLAFGTILNNCLTEGILTPGGTVMQSSTRIYFTGGIPWDTGRLTYTGAGSLTNDIRVDQLYRKAGTTAQRPGGSSRGGMFYYDETIAKIIAFDGVVWRDANGVVV